MDLNPEDPLPQPFDSPLRRY